MRKLGFKSQPPNPHPQPCSDNSCDPRASIRWHASRCPVVSHSTTWKDRATIAPLPLPYDELEQVQQVSASSSEAEAATWQSLENQSSKIKTLDCAEPWRSSTAFQSSLPRLLLYLPSSLPLIPRISTRDTGHGPNRRTSKETTFTGIWGSPHCQPCC